MMRGMINGVDGCSDPKVQPSNFMVTSMMPGGGMMYKFAQSPPSAHPTPTYGFMTPPAGLEWNSHLFNLDGSIKTSTPYSSGNCPSFNPDVSGPLGYSPVTTSMNPRSGCNDGNGTICEPKLVLVDQGGEYQSHNTMTLEYTTASSSSPESGPSPPQRFPCTKPSCSRAFKSERGLKMHLARGHLPFERYPCGHDNCPAGFNRMYELNQHLKKVHNGKAFKCVRCNRTVIETWQQGEHERLCGRKPTIVKNPLYVPEEKGKKPDIIPLPSFFNATAAVLSLPVPIEADDNSMSRAGTSKNVQAICLADVKHEPGEEESDED